jgi:hypothetical protein
MRPHQKVLLRDVSIFLFKLWIDGFKDFALTIVCLGAALIDFIRGPRKGGLLFYRAMRWSERFDLWLNLYGVSEGAGEHEEGLFGVSKSGSPTFLGKLEELTGGERGQQTTKSSEPETDHEVGNAILSTSLERSPSEPPPA